MYNKTPIKLYLPQIEGISPLKVKVFQEELSKINKQFPLKENQINASKTYILKHEDELEVGLFIRSTVKNNIIIEEICLAIEDENNQIVLLQKFNFKHIGIIPPNSGIPLTVRFDKDINLKFQNINNYSIKFLTTDELQGFLGTRTEIENIPTNISFEDEKELLDFAYNLQTLKANEVSFDMFKLCKDESGKIIADILIRNGHNKEAKLEVFPITIIDDNNNIIAKCVFKNSNGIVKISSHKSKLVNFIFEPSSIYSNDYDILKCKAIFE